MTDEKFGFVHILTDFEVAPEKRWRMTGEKFGFVPILTAFEVAPEKRWRMTGEKFGFVHFLTDFEVAPEKKMTDDRWKVRLCTFSYYFFHGCERAIELFA